MAGRIRSVLLPSSPHSPIPPTRESSRHSTPLHFLTLLLNHCATFNHIAQAHCFMLSRGLDQDNLLLSNLIHASSSLGFSDYAFIIFQLKQKPNLHLYNTMIRSLSRSDSAGAAIALFNRIQPMGFRPDTYSFPFVLKAAAHLSLLGFGRGVHGLAFRLGFESDVHVSTGLVHMYSACTSVHDSRRLFDEIPHRDVILWNAMVAGYAKVGDADAAREMFDRMPERNLISWTAVIAGYAQMNRADEAIAVFRMMQREDCIQPDEVALLSALSACAQLGALDLGEWIHHFINDHGLNKTTPLMNALIDMYAKSGCVWKAFEVFKSMKKRTVVTWTTMISGFAVHGLGREALKLFDRMERDGTEPNDVTFVPVLSACSHIGDVELGRSYFRRMKSQHQINPQIEHYGCMVDILGRAGHLREARDLVRDMPFEPNAAIWGSLLASARICGDVELGEEALRHLVEVEPQNSGNYSMLSNIYASHGKWRDVGKLRKVMRDSGVVKVPGGSSIELDGEIHEFTCRDGGHPSIEKIYGVLGELNGQLKLCGDLLEEGCFIL
ncbi:Pentatricopeptide repeat-containing protein [Platanthera zijinensis]|uniref:Pentatricopeptide repeat-containing protein n=1 Tax=Platanthera zijinensis TaxID=2320716 RepID=A0AAP0AY89_9ASPA